MDGRALPKDPNPSFMGYSVGRWDGDTLVVDSIGFNETSWLDFGGHPHSEALRTTERLTRKNFGRLDVEVRFDDPKIVTRPFTVPVHAEIVTDTEMLEYVCTENQKDVEHLVGKASDDKKLAVKVAPQILSQYVGAYTFKAPDDPNQVIELQHHAGGRDALDGHRRQGPAGDGRVVERDVLGDGHPPRFRERGRDGHPSHLPHRGRGHEGDEGPLSYRQTKLAASSMLPVPLYLAT